MRRRHHHRSGGFQIASTSPFELFNGANSYGAGRRRMRRGSGWRKAKQMEPMEAMGGRRRRR